MLSEHTGDHQEHGRGPQEHHDHHGVLLTRSRDDAASLPESQCG